MSSFNPRGRLIVIPSNVGPILKIQIPLPSFDGATNVIRHMNMFLDNCLANNIRNAYHLMMLFPTTLVGMLLSGTIVLRLGPSETGVH